MEELSWMERFPLPNNLKEEDIKRREVTIKELGVTFSQNVFSRLGVRCWEGNVKNPTNECECCIWWKCKFKKASEAFDALDYIKNLMSSRKVIKMINHLGHCTSYYTTEEVEVEATFESAKQNLVIPIGMNLSPRCGIDVVWDNFDRFIDTKLQLKKHYTIQLVLHRRRTNGRRIW